MSAFEQADLFAVTGKIGRVGTLTDTESEDWFGSNGALGHQGIMSAAEEADDVTVISEYRYKRAIAMKNGRFYEVSDDEVGTHPIIRIHLGKRIYGGTNGNPAVYDGNGNLREIHRWETLIS
jgi:hypothetical protein